MKLTEKTIKQIIAENDRDPSTKTKTDRLMFMLNANILTSCLAIEEGKSPRDVVRPMADQVVEVMGAGVKKFVAVMDQEDRMPYSRILRLLNEALQKEAVRRGLKIPEYVVVIDTGGE